MTSKPTTVTQFLSALPKDRRDALKAVRKVILDNLDSGYSEGVQSGAICYFVPHSVYPAGYHCDPTQPLPYVGIASQKNYMAIYLFCVYTSEDEQRRFREAWMRTGKKLDMGKSCVRFRKIEDVALDVIGKTIKRTTVKKFVAGYESALAQTSRGAKKPTKKTAKAKSKTGARKVAKKPTSHAANPSARRRTRA